MELQKKVCESPKKQGVARDSFFVCMDWQRYSKRFYEDIQDIWVLFAFFLFQIAVSGERDHWKDLSKYFETWELTWNGKTACKVVLKDFFSKADHLERKNQEGTSWQRAREQRLVFIHSLVHLPVKPWKCESTYLLQLRGSWFSFDQRSKSHHNWCYNMSQRQYTNLAKFCRTKFSNGSHHFHWSNDTAWSTMAVTLSASSERYLSHPTEQYPTWQSSNTHTHTVELIGEDNFFNGALIGWVHTSHSYGQQL